MERIDELVKDMLSRVLQHEEERPVTPPNVRATALFTEVGAHFTAYTALSGSQVFGRGGYRAGAAQRQILAGEIRSTLVDMAATARGLEPNNPGITEQFRLGRQARSHQELLATAQAFLTAVEPPEVKQLFTDRAFPANFDVQLTAKTAELEAAVSRKAGGLLGQKQGTLGMRALRRQVTATMRELRALMVKHLRDTDPTQLELWRTAARVYRGPAAGAPGTGGDTGSGDGSTAPPVTQSA